MTRKMRLHKLILSFALVIGMVLPGPVSHAAETTAGSAVWSADIPALLQAGDYVEGQVVVGVDCSISETAGSALAAVEDDAGTAEELTAASGISIEIIEDPTKTTEELLYLLAEDPRVVFAEPNYTVNRAGEEGQPVEDPEADESAGDPIQFVPGDEQDPQVYERTADLTDLQWSSSILKQLGDDEPDASIHVPDFGGTGSNMEGDPVIVAVIDQPVDYTNPDIAPVMYHFTAEEQQALGCGEYGYNATWQSNGNEFVFWPGGDHGTHCAGIIGAAWDGHGISGVASNVRIISIQNCLPDGNTSLINNLRAFTFVKKAIEAGIDIRITSNSYGLMQYSHALDAIVRDIGENYGVVSCFAAGNESLDIGAHLCIAPEFHDNPYAVVVASMSNDDQIAGYSNFSREYVDIAAPGSNILSTVLSDKSIYLPGAVPEDDLAYYGFEQNDDTEMFIFGAERSGNDYQTITDGMISKTEEGGPHYTGQYAGIVPGDPDSEVRILEVSLGDQSAAPDGLLYFGASFYIPGGMGDVGFQVKNRNSGSYVRLPVSSNSSYGDDWFYSFAKMDSSIVDLSDLKIYIVLSNLVNASEIYIDSVGLGRSLIPYSFMSGTSMATPLVAGATAVLSAGHGGIRGEELASLVKASARLKPDLDTKTRNSGVLDLASDVELSPVITEAVYQEGTLTLKGRNFGGSIGELQLYGLVVGADDTLLYDNATDTGHSLNWSDRLITLEYPDLRGTLLVSVMSGKGKLWRKTLFAEPAEDLYETDLTIDRYLVDPENPDVRGDYDSCGVLTGLDGKLYYLPTSTEVERSPAAKKMWAYDTNTGIWEERASLPEPLYNMSAALYRGRLMVTGTAARESSDGVLDYSEILTQKVYQYDPVKDVWSSCSSDNVVPGQRMVDLGGKLYLVNGSECVAYTPERGAAAELAYSEDLLSVTAGKAGSGEIYIYNYTNKTFGMLKAGAYTDLSDRLPEFKAYEGNDAESVYTRRGVLLMVSEGILLIGPPSVKEDGGIGSDTFLLKWGAEKFVPYEKRVSVNRLFNVAAASYRGAVYVIASTYPELEDPVFRATAMAVDAYPGDVTPYQWKHNAKGWWIQDSNGWYPKNQWLMVNGLWYYFDEQGYMAHEEWRKGWWLGRNGAWTYEAKGSWYRNSRGWWYQDTAGWYPVNTWQKIDGKWYHFDEKGYMQTGRQKIDGKWYTFSKSGALQ